MLHQYYYLHSFKTVKFLDPILNYFYLNVTVFHPDYSFVNALILLSDYFFMIALTLMANYSFKYWLIHEHHVANCDQVQFLSLCCYVTHVLKQSKSSQFIHYWDWSWIAEIHHRSFKQFSQEWRLDLHLSIIKLKDFLAKVSMFIWLLRLVENYVETVYYENISTQ